MKKINEVSKFYVILARKIIKIPDLVWYLPEKFTKFHMIFDRKNGRILHNKFCPRNIFPEFGGGAHAPLPPVSYAYKIADVS